jgi:hypothetical protein
MDTRLRLRIQSREHGIEPPVFIKKENFLTSGAIIHKRASALSNERGCEEGAKCGCRM